MSAVWVLALGCGNAAQHDAPASKAAVDSTRAEPPPPIAGWVIDSDDKPIEGATVTIADDTGAAGGVVAWTDTVGAFRLADVGGSGERTLLIDGPNILPSQVRWRPGAGAERIVVTRPVALAARVSHDGVAVAGAIVSLSDGGGPDVRTAHTDRDGRVEFSDLAPGAYELWAQSDGRVSPIVRSSRLSTGAEQAVELALAPGASVRGQVTAEGGTAAGATLSLIPIDVDHSVRSIQLDATGSFAFDALPPGRWQVEIEAPGLIAPDGTFVSATPGQPATLDLALYRGGVVTGIVTDASGAPVHNATLILRGQGRRPAMLGRVDRALVASTGARWVHPLAGRRQLPIRDTRRFGAARDGMRPAECGNGHCGVDVGVARGSIVHAASDGVVGVAAMEPRGRAGRYVMLEHPGGLRTFYMHLDEVRGDLEIGQTVLAGEPIGTLGASGVFRSGPHLHFAMSQEQAGRSWFIDPEPLLRHAVVLPDAASLEDGAGAATSALVATLRHPGLAPATGAAAPAALRLVTDDNGRFRIDGVVPGEYAVSAFHAELAPGTSSLFSVRPGLETGDVAVALPPGVVIYGEVRGQYGPVVGARVVAVEGAGESARAVAKATTDVAGRFQLRPLAGGIALSVSAPGYGSIGREVSLVGRGRMATRREESFDLSLHSSALRGRVRDPLGFALRGAIVRVADGPARGRKATTDERGDFAIIGVPTGSYQVDVSSRDFAPARAELSTGRAGELAVRQGGGIRLQLRDAHTRAALAGVRIDARGPDGARARASSRDGGIAELAALAPGRWTIRAQRAGYVIAEQTVDIRPAHRARSIDQEQVVELGRGASVGGVVRDDSGSRVAGARVSVGGVSTTTDQDGRFRLTNVPTGRVSIRAQTDGQTGAIQLELAPGDELVTLQIDVD